MRRLLVLTAAAMLTLGIAGCGGDDGATGATGPQGPAGTPGATGPQGPAGTSAITLNANTPAATFAALDMDVSGVSVTIASPPVVNFKITDRTTGTPIVGYGSKAKCFPRNNTTTPYEGNCYPNLAFALAKLVPGSGGSPSRWVNYIVVAPATVATNGTVNARTTLTTPSTENNGTLVDNGDGTYKYTFYNDIPGMAALVAGITAPAGSNKADLDDVSYSADVTHRLVVVLSGSAPGTGSNNSTGLSTGFPTSVSLQKPVNFIYDFVPATGQAPAASANRKMVENANCESCHSTLGGLPGGDGASLDFHGGSRNDIEYCVICHTEQRKYGRAEATFNATTRAFSTTTYKLDGQAIGNALNFIHKIHVAGVMTRTNYDYGGVKFDQGGYSQDIRNCDKCHDSFNAATPQAGLWKTEANRKACSSCHDGINFDTGVGITLADAQAARVAGTFPPPNSTGFFGKAHPENSTDGSCLNSSCHAAGAPGDPDVVHKPVTPPNTKSALHVAGGSANTNAGWIASNTARLPAGAIKVSYEIKSVSTVVDTTVTPNVKRPQIVFRMLQNGVRTDLNVLGAKPDNPVSGQQELWDGFTGGPSVYFVWAVPQDGITKPADFNTSVSGYLRCIWNGSAPLPDPDQCAVSTGKLEGPDADGYYTVTMNNAIISDSAVMLTGGVGYSYNVTTSLPLTQTNLPAYPAAKSTVVGLNAGQPNVTGGLIVVTPNAQKVATGFTGRRAIVEDKRCNACHQELGTFTEDAFHGGQRNDGTTCSWCHTPNRNSSGWTADSKQFVHAIHARDKRTVPYTWHSISTTDNFSNIVYPGVLARCEQCHIPGSYDFSNSASADAAGLGADGLNKRQFVYISGTPSATDISLSPYVVGGTNYGAGFGYTVATGVTTLPADTTLIQSPTTSACAGCHDSSLAISHMKVNGGRFYEPRTTQFAPASNAAAATAATEQCMICHSSGRQADTKAVHAR